MRSNTRGSCGHTQRSAPLPRPAAPRPAPFFLPRRAGGREGRAGGEPGTHQRGGGLHVQVQRPQSAVSVAARPCGESEAGERAARRRPGPARRPRPYPLRPPRSAFAVPPPRAAAGRAEPPAGPPGTATAAWPRGGTAGRAATTRSRSAPSARAGSGGRGGGGGGGGGEVPCGAVRGGAGAGSPSGARSRARSCVLQMPVTVGPYGQSQPSCFDRVKMGFVMGFAVGMAAGALFGTFSCLRCGGDGTGRDGRGGPLCSARARPRSAAGQRRVGLRLSETGLREPRGLRGIAGHGRPDGRSLCAETPRRFGSPERRKVHGTRADARKRAF